MRSIGTEIVFVHALTHRVMYDHSDLPAWMVKERLRKPGRDFTGGGSGSGSDFDSENPWRLNIYFCNGSILIYVIPGGLDDVLQNAYDVLAMAGTEVPYVATN